jgi:hypothetical protein
VDADEKEQARWLVRIDVETTRNGRPGGKLWRQMVTGKAWGPTCERCGMMGQG